MHQLILENIIAVLHQSNEEIKVTNDRKQFLIDQIPAVLYVEPSQRAYLFVHGQCGCKEEGAAFAETACPAEYQVLAIDLPEHGARKGEEIRFNPWTVVLELQAVLGYTESR